MERVKLEYNEAEYIIFIQEVEFLSKGAKGQYLPDEKKILLLDSCDDSTIYHESIHAIIDMFKSTEESFDECFYSELNYAEEAFCHYVCELAGWIKKLL